MTRKSFILLMLLAALGAGAPAHAGVLDYAGQKLDAVNHKLGAVWNFLGSSEPETGVAAVESTPKVWIAPMPRSLDAKAAPEARLAMNEIAAPRLPAPRAPAAPSVEKGGKRLFCVEYARALSGLAIFGDAKYWWGRAKNLYARASHPVEAAVMVFSGSAKLKKGHVAVVSQIVSAREIRVEQANWMNKGEIDHATPVLDVSANNDWSKVRVWDMPSHRFGSIYAVSGFILKPLLREAANN